MRRITTIAVGVVTFAACMVFVATLARATLYYENEAELTQPKAANSAHPVPKAEATPFRLRIPAINVDAKIQSVGLGKSGNMAVPSNYTDAAWYRDGPAPGQLGSAVIDGHV